MRRLTCICVLAAAVAAPAAAQAVSVAPGDGTLVVQNGAAPNGVALLTLVLKGTVVGHLSTGSPDLEDLVVIDNLNGGGDFTASPVADALLTTKTVTSTRTKYLGSDFRFRAVANNYYKITIYGTGVNLFAVGQGKLTLQGTPDPNTSGRYSLNGQNFNPLPTVPTAWLQLSASAKEKSGTHSH